MTIISFDIPIKAQSTSNLREHWAVRAKRVDAQKRATRARCPPWTGGPLVTVTLIRVASRRLDDDNLRGALKSVRDAVASWLRMDDASPLVRWEYAQEKGSDPRVRVEVLGTMQQSAERAWTGEMASAENGLLPAPRKPRPISPANPPEYEATGEPTLATQMDRKATPRRERVCTCDHDDIPFCVVHADGGTAPRKGVSGRRATKKRTTRGT